jgi:aspartyl-tRNA(Asn)/glutamyl-tRNA(Gln) amidotransferase subunit A
MDSIFFYRNQQKPDTLNQGLLQNMKFAIQPNISVKGWPTEAGSAALAGFKALEDAAIVENISREGGCLAGSTRMSEFGFGLNKSMAGVVLEKRKAHIELVIDMAGEARLAAARVGVCGFKPSYGLISRIGLVGLIPSMETCGILAGDIKSIRDVLQTIAGPDERDFSLPDESKPDLSASEIDPKKTTIGMITEIFTDMPSQEHKLFEKEINGLKNAGFIVKTLSFPNFAQFLLVHQIVGSVEASSCAGRYDSVRYGRRAPGAKNWNEMYLQSRGVAFGTLLKSYLIQGAFFQFERYNAYEDACRLRALLVAEMQKLQEQVDFLAFPTVNCIASGTPVSLADLYAHFIYTAFANVTGEPALYLPSSSGGKQAGLQLTAPRRADGRLLDLGEYLLNSREGGK